MKTFASERLQVGSLLLAQPMMEDPNFRRSVVLVCEHNEDGSFGLVLNQQLRHPLRAVLPYLSSFEAPLFLGGPLAHNSLHIIHRIPEIEKKIQIAENLYWGGDFDQIQSLLDKGTLFEQDIRFFIGYAGWTAGQLNTEVTQKDWILAQSASDLIFDTLPRELWNKTLKLKGGYYPVLANFPKHPKLN